ncbi:hypothetical protein FISHEDRAFT_77401 [Fistulina hepatica ATCC 64428]|uniref:Uncharacterized protein n=1 Tax=Fistulina hepatica ATCC 64428 TaxID=1128425 RepID=A0A0D7A1I0_9AGAR|nr:hypothetical protein FISHEDRAFT_77401 [Fistulina hepatica ATCC 64428]
MPPLPACMHIADLCQGTAPEALGCHPERQVRARGPSGHIDTEAEAIEQGDISDYDPPSSPTPSGPPTARKRPNAQTATIVSPTPQSANCTATLGDVFMEDQEVSADQGGNNDVPYGVQHPNTPEYVAVPPQLYEDPIKIPFPADREDQPTFACLNPLRLDTSHFVAPDVQFVGCPIPSNEGPWPVSVIRSAQLFNNLTDAQATMIQANPTAYLALVPLGGGLGFYKSEHGLSFPGAAEEACAAIATTIGEDHSLIRVYAPQPKVIRSNLPPFAYPITAILEGATPTTMDFLASHQVWSFSPSLAFVARRFDSDSCPWMIATYTGSAVRRGDDEEARFIALAAIKRALWCSAAFCRVVSTITAQKLSWANLSPLQRMVKATESMEIFCCESTVTPDTTRVSHYQLHGCPITRLVYHPLLGGHCTYSITSDDLLRKSYIETIRKETRDIKIGFAVLKSTFLFEPCRFCKDPSHSTHDCPLPRSPLWFGPVIKDLPAESETAARNRALAAGAHLIEDQEPPRDRRTRQGRGGRRGRGGERGRGGRTRGR